MKKKMEDFFRKRPGMLKKYEFSGTFKNFVSDIAKSVTPKREKNYSVKAIINEAGRILSNEIVLDSLEDQILKCPIISYADHHGLLKCKFLYNSNILYSEIIKELKLPYVLVFATGNIPLSNYSYPRGFHFKGLKFNFFRKKQNNTSVYLLDAKLEANQKEGLGSFILNYSKEMLNSEQNKFLEYLFFDCLQIEKATKNYEIFSDQVTFLNYKLWKYYFDNSIRDSIPEIIYLQSNRIIFNLLLNEIKTPDSLISLILFEPKVRNIFFKNFTGIQGCWAEDRGSQLFWGIDEKKRRITLRIDDSANSLLGKNFCLKLEREAIINALETDRILPTIFFDLLIITFIEGYLTLGGFNQLEYLPQMQEAHIISLIDYMIQVQEAHVKSLKEIGMHKLVDQFAGQFTDGLVCGMMPFDFDSGIDLIWHYNSHNGKFNGNLDGGLTRADLDKMLNMKVKDMITSAVEAMLENV